MVRPNDNSPVRDESGGSGLDPNQTVTLSDTLKDEGKWTGEVADPEGTTNLEPIDIRGDATVDKKG